MNINEAFPSAYINAATLKGKALTLTVNRFEAGIEMTDGQKKPVLYFAEGSAGLILNKTNATVMASIHGDETDNWIGKTILLRPEKVSFQGSMVDGVRIAAAQQAATAAKVAPQPMFVEEDDVPF